MIHTTILVLFMLIYQSGNISQTDSKIPNLNVSGSPIQKSLINNNQNPSILSEKGEIVLDGYIGNGYEIIVWLKPIPGNKFEGKYLYKRVQQYINLDGKVNGNQLELTEKDPKGQITGKFVGDLSSYPSIRGSWSKPDGTGQLNFYLKKIMPLGISNSTSYEYVRTKTIKNSNDKIVEVTGFSDSVMQKVNSLLKIGKDQEMKSLGYDVRYNLNGILTVAYNQENDEGWSETTYKCINTKVGRYLEFDDIFRSNSKPEIAQLIATKAKENCSEQLDADFSAASIDIKNTQLIVTREGISFSSPCGRSVGYYLGIYTVDFTFDELKQYLK